MFKTYTDSELIQFIEKCDQAIENGDASFSISDSTYEEAIAEAKERHIYNDPEYTNIDGIFMGSIPKIHIMTELPHSDPDSLWIISPKYDGVSALATYVVRDGHLILTNARTRGIIRNNILQCSDITDKLRLIAHEIVMPNLRLDVVKELMIRGEMVLSDSYVAKHKDEIKAPAAAASGFINRKDITEREFEEAIVFKPYEIVRLIDRTNRIQPVQQAHAYQILGTVHSECIKYSDISINMLVDWIKKYKAEVLEPIDGIVFSPKEWVYPATKANRSKNDYGKYAYKTQIDFSSMVEEVEWIIDSKGQFSFLIHFTPTIINGATRKKSKMSYEQLIQYKGEFGIGSIVNIKLHDGTYPYITGVIVTNKTKSLYFDELRSKKCPYCGASISQGISSSNTHTIQCTNVNCVGKMSYRVATLLKERLHLSGLSVEAILKLAPEEQTLFNLVQRFGTKLKFKPDKKKLAKLEDMFSRASVSDILLGFDIWTKKDVQLLLMEKGVMNPQGLIQNDRNAKIAIVKIIMENKQKYTFDNVAIDLFNSFYEIFKRDFA